MLRHHTIHGWRAVLLALAVTALLPAAALAATFNLKAGTTTKTMPDGAVVTMWGFALGTDSGGTVTYGDVTVPGPTLTVPPGDTTLTINLTNDLPAPISLVIPGQVAAMTPTFSGGRVMSFTHEAAAAGGTATYTWTSLKPGTFLYESGTNPAVQVQMGLYGAVKKDAAAGEAYPGRPYDNEVMLLFSEIDPMLHTHVANGTYGTPPPTGITSTIEYAPKYFLVNGAPFSASSLPLPAGDAGQRLLIRSLNAGLQTHVPVLLGGYMRLVAEDGNPYSYAREDYSINLPAGKTADALFTPSAPGTYPLFDRRLNVTNAGAYPGGMIARLSVGGTAANAPPAITSTPVTTATVGVPYSYDVNAFDPDAGDTLTFSLTASPAGMTINAATGLIQWTPQANQAGSNPVTVRVTDSGGLFATQSFTVTVQLPAIHIGDLDGTSVNIGGNRWRATVTATVHNQNHGPVAGATVTGTWSAGDGNGRTLSCTTNGAGQCNVTSGRLSRATNASVIFTVTTLTAAGATYQPSANHDPDGSSTGTSITVPRP